MDIEYFVERITSAAEVSKIYVYGEKYSSADGSLREASFCVVTPSDPKEVEKKLYLEIDADFPFNLLVYSERRWAFFTSDKTSYAHSISQKGRLIYGEP